MRNHSNVISRLLVKLEHRSNVIVDIGANNGQVAEQFRAEYPLADIHCFEPHDRTRKALEELHAHDPKVFAYPFAVSDGPGTADFFVNHRPDTSSLLPRPSKGRRYYPADATTSRIETVETISLDRWAKERDVEQIDLLKIDIQGGELAALKGASDLLGSGAVSLIFTEIMFIAHYEAQPLFHKLAEELEQHGYSLFAFYNLSHGGDGQLRQGDALFVSPHVRDTVIADLPDAI